MCWHMLICLYYTTISTPCLYLMPVNIALDQRIPGLLLSTGKTVLGSRAFVVAGPKLWSSVPSLLHSVSCLMSELNSEGICSRLLSLRCEISAYSDFTGFELASVIDFDDCFTWSDIDWYFVHCVNDAYKVIRLEKTRLDSGLSAATEVPDRLCCRPRPMGRVRLVSRRPYNIWVLAVGRELIQRSSLFN